MKFKVLIEETLSKTIEVEAEDASAAGMKAERMWADEEVVLDESDFDGNVYVEVLDE